MNTTTVKPILTFIAHNNICLQRWARILGFAFPRSRVPGILGTQARGNANFVQEHGNAECERIGMLILRSCGEI